MREDGAYKAKDGVEFREGGVDEGVGDNVVTLGDAYDTVGADLTLTDTGDENADARGKANAEADPSIEGATGVFTHHYKKSHKSVDTLSGGES